MKNAPILSLCIPTHGKAQLLKKCLFIALNQAKELKGAVEIVVSDNASEDETPLVIADFKEKYGKILIDHRNPINIGLFENCKKVIDLSKGRYCWIIGNDDIVEPHSLNRIIDLLRENSSCEYFFSNYSEWDPSKDSVDTIIYKPHVNLTNKNQNNYSVKTLRDILLMDHNVFTPLYASIMKRNRWKLALANTPQNEKEFSSIDTYIPHALYIIDNMLDCPGYYIGTPLLRASRNTSWDDHAPYYFVECLPALYDKLEAKGIDKNILNSYRAIICPLSAFMLMLLVRHPHLKDHTRFSILHYLCTHWKKHFFWKVLGSAALQSSHWLLQKVQKTSLLIKNHLFSKKNLPTDGQ
jgi:glycosyltransferase involved in cell wall biosynthesis